MINCNYAQSLCNILILIDCFLIYLQAVYVYCCLRDIPATDPDVMASASANQFVVAL